MKTVLILLLAGAVLGTGVIATQAAERGRLAERFAALGVTEEQKSELRAVLKKHLPEIEPLVQRCVAERRALRDRIRSESFDEAAIRAQAARLAAAEADLAVVRAKVAAEVRPLLTSEQHATLEEMNRDAQDHVDYALSRIAKHIAGD